MITVKNRDIVLIPCIPIVVFTIEYTNACPEKKELFKNYLLTFSILQLQFAK